MEEEYSEAVIAHAPEILHRLANRCRACDKTYSNPPDQGCAAMQCTNTKCNKGVCRYCHAVVDGGLNAVKNSHLAGCQHNPYKGTGSCLNVHPSLPLIQNRLKIPEIKTYIQRNLTEEDWEPMLRLLAGALARQGLTADDVRPSP